MNPAGLLRVETAADLNNAIIVTERADAVGLAYLLRALRDGQCACLPILPTTSNSALKQFIAKLGVAFWDYLGSRLSVPGQLVVPPLPNLVRCRGQPT